MLYFFKKQIKKNTTWYHYQNLDNMIYMIYNLLEISSLYICVPKITIMMYRSWDTEWNRQNLLSFWAIFCPFSQLTTQKIKILKLKKISGDIILHIFTINDNYRYDVWCLGYGAKQTISCHSGPFFLLLYTQCTQKIRFLEKWTMHFKIS